MGSWEKTCHLISISLWKIILDGGTLSNIFRAFFRKHTLFFPQLFSKTLAMPKILPVFPEELSWLPSLTSHAPPFSLWSSLFSLYYLVQYLFSFPPTTASPLSSQTTISCWNVLSFNFVFNSISWVSVVCFFFFPVVFQWNAIVFFVFLQVLWLKEIRNFKALATEYTQNMLIQPLECSQRFITIFLYRWGNWGSEI